MYKKLLAVVLSAALSASLLTGCSAEDLKAYLASLGITWGSSSSSSSSSASSAGSRAGSSNGSSTPKPGEADVGKPDGGDDQPAVIVPPIDPQDPALWPMANDTLTIPGGITSLTQDMVTGFLQMHPGCTVTAIKLPESVTTIGPNAFGGLGKLTAINLEHVEEVGSNAFRGTQLTQAHLDRAVTIKSGAFFGCPLTSVSLPRAVSVGSRAFADNPNLVSVSLPMAASLSSGAFLNCKNLRKVYIGQKMSTIESQVFEGCDNLKALYYAGDANLSLNNWGWTPTDTAAFSSWGKDITPDEQGKTYLVCNVTSINLDQAWPQTPVLPASPGI